MKISLRTEYALRAILELVDAKKDSPVSIKKICHKQKLPYKFIEQLFRQLKKQNIVMSILGSNGGYFLNQSLAEINFSHIMNAVDDSVVSQGCQKSYNLKFCSGKDCKVTHTLHKIQTDLTAYFKNITLDKIIKQGECDGQNLS